MVMEASKVDNEDADLDHFSAISIGSELSKSVHKAKSQTNGTLRNQFHVPTPLGTDLRSTNDPISIVETLDPQI